MTDVNYVSVSKEPISLLIYDKEMELDLSNNQISADIFEGNPTFQKILKESDSYNGVVHILHDTIHISFWEEGANDKLYIKNYVVDLIEFKRLCEDGCIVEVCKPLDCKDIQSLIKR